MKNSAPTRAMIFAFGLLALAACAKVEEPVGQDPATQIEPAPETHSVQVFIDKTDDTKTSVVEGQDGASYIWNEGDEQFLHVYENGVEGEITGIQFSPDYTSAALTVTFSGTPTAPYTYTAKYAKTIGEGGNPVIRADQKPTSSSFDPAADVMISRADADVTGLSSRASEVSFTMGRVVSVNRMMLTGLVAGEKVSKVEFTLGKNFVGSLYEGNETYTGGSGKLTATYDTPLAVNALGQFPVYFTCAPVADAAITSVVVTTDQNVYTKSGSAFSGKSISFAVGTMKRFNMGMSGCGTPVVYPVIYKEVTSASQIVDGGVYLVSSTKTDNSVVAMSSYATGSNKYYTAVDVTVTNDQTLGKYIELTNEQVVTVTLESAGSSQFFIKDSDGQYLNYSGSSNNVTRGSKSNTDQYKWTVAANKIESVNVSGRKLQYNANDPRFACYSSSQRSIALYKQGYGTPIFPLATPGNLVATSDDQGNVHVEWDAVSGAASYTVTCTGQTAKTGITTTSTDFTGLSSGIYTITVKAISSDQSVNLDSEVASTEITVTVSSPKGSENNPYTASEAMEEASKLDSNTIPTDDVYVTGIISNVVSYNSKYHSITYYISNDGSTTTDQFMIYGGLSFNGGGFSSIGDLAEGYKVVVKGHLRNYQGNTPELYQNNEITSLLKPASSTVTTSAASSIGSTQATLNGSYSGASGQIYETGFYYGASQNDLSESVTTDGSNNASGSFSCTVTGLVEGNTYYYKAYVLEFNAVSGQYEERFGSVSNFTPTSSSSNTSLRYLGCYEVPSVTVSGTETMGYYNTDDRDDEWYRYNTGSSKQKVVTHSFTTSNKRVRNYTVLFDGDKHAPLWAAFPMHASVYGGSTERSNSWTGDPALTSYSNWQQTGLDNAGTVGYSRGHFVASQYRKKNDAANMQTFYYSNQAPQWQNGFNSGVWSSLEERLLAISPTAENDTLYVVVGVMYDESYYDANSSFPRTLTSGGVSIPIPTHFYTCAMRCAFNSAGTVTSAQGIAFVYSNVSHTGDKYYANNYVTSIDAIEAATGYEFFPNVPSGIQATAEANTNHTWFTGQSSNNISNVTDNNWGTL